MPVDYGLATAVDITVRAAVGDAVSVAVSRAVDGAVRNAVGDAVRVAVGDAVNAVRVAVHVAVRIDDRKDKPMMIWDVIEQYMVKMLKAGEVPSAKTFEETVRSEYAWSRAVTVEAHLRNPVTALRADRELVAQLTEAVMAALCMTTEQQEEQRRSFAYGNTKLSNEAVTREMVVDAAAVAKKPSEPGEDYYGTKKKP